MTKKKSTEFVNLVNFNPRMDLDESQACPKLELDTFTNMWVFGMGLVIAIIRLALPLLARGIHSSLSWE